MAAQVAAGGAAPPVLDDLMPWSVRPLRTGRPWVTAPDAASLRARWDLLVEAEGVEQERLFRPSRSRTPQTAAAALPGRSTGTGGFARDPGPYPDPVRIMHGPFDEHWLIPDHRLLDAARPELWRVADAHQLFAVEHGYVPQGGGPALSVTGLLPDGHSPAGRPGRIRPLYRRPGAQEPNLAPGLPGLLHARYGDPGGAESLLAWALAAPPRPGPSYRCRRTAPCGRRGWRWAGRCCGCSCAARAAGSARGCRAAVGRMCGRRSRRGPKGWTTTPGPGRCPSAPAASPPSPPGPGSSG